MAVLLSSHFIYNSDEISWSPFESLGVGIRRVSLLAGKSGETLLDEKFKEIMPNFTWVGHDFSKERKYLPKKLVSQAKVFEELLEHRPYTDFLSKAENTKRLRIRTCF